MNSETSSLSPDRPPDCPSEIWSELASIVNEVDRPEVSKEVVLEIFDININDYVVLKNAVHIEPELHSDTAVPMMPVNTEVQVQNEQDHINENEGNITEGVHIPEPHEERKVLTRKRNKNYASWKQNVSKANRQKGKEYIDSKGNLRPERKVRTETCHTCNCPFKCTQIITEEERQYIHDQFWKLEDCAKTHFYSKHVKRIVPSRKRTQEEISKKKFSYEYYFYVAAVKIRVCQEYFLNTLNISKQRIYYFFKINNNEDVPNLPKQGKHKKKFTDPDKKDEVKAHIKSFPAVESHYCRAKTKKKYLERGLNLQKMYDLYRSSFDNPVKFNIYSKIFNSEFNIGFFKPKKDLCDKCELYKVLKEPTVDEIRKQNDHIWQKQICKLERHRDRTRFSEDNEVGVITFDLQNTFSLPKANVSNFYYKTKLSCYNLTAHLNRTRVVYNAIWHEFSAGRAANHIAAAILRILTNVMIDNPQLKKIILWSDSCVAQNKNSIMSFALQHSLHSDCSKNLEIIGQKFSEAGHGNVQEIDNAHSCIEKHLRNIEIWSPISLMRQLLAMPSSWKLQFKILQMLPNHFLNFQMVSKTLNYKIVPYTRLKHIIYNKADVNKIRFKERFDADYEDVKIQKLETINRNKKQAKSRPEKKLVPYNFSNEVPLAVQDIAISDLKRKHLTEMTPFIPDDAKKLFYNTIHATKKIQTQTSSTPKAATIAPKKRAPSREKKTGLKKSKK